MWTLTMHADQPLNPAAVELDVGSMVGSYRIVKQIGSGGMGVVFEAVHTLIPRRVAIKVLHPQLVDDPDMHSRLLQEAAILDELRHPGIVRVFDCEQLDDGRPWLAMELVCGESLGAKLVREATLSADAVCALVGAIADVLATVHARGIVHRDLKPDNVLLADPDSGYALRIIDWGVARLGPRARLTLPGVTCGTPTYMSPEQAGGHDIAPPCDIYSLGVIAYEALSGGPPLDDRSLASLSNQCPEAPVASCELIEQMLLKEPASRPTADDVCRAIQAIDLGVRSESWRELASVVIDDLAPHSVRWTPESPSTPRFTRIRPLLGCTHVAGEIQRKH